MHSLTSLPINPLESPYLKKEKLEVRTYQVKIAKKCIGQNYLVSILTGLGKTIIAILTTAGILTRSFPNSKIVMVAPTRPLILQHAKIFQQFLSVKINEESVLTGSVKPTKRIQTFQQRRILFYTPQTLRNDLKEQRYNLKDVSLLIIDEAHKASGDYAYTEIASIYHESNPDGSILALTASPGAAKEQIHTLCKNLFIPNNHIELRDREDEDVKSYVKQMAITKIGVDISDFMKEILTELNEILRERMIFLMNCGYLIDYNGDPIEDVDQLTRFSHHLSLQLNTTLLSRSQELKGSVVLPDSQDEYLYQAISVNAEVLRIYHMIKTTESQGLNVLFEYLEQIQNNIRKSTASKALKNLASDSRLYLLYKTIRDKANSDSSEELIHPKLIQLKDILTEELKENPQARILQFAEFRDTIQVIYNILKKLPNLYPVRFVGQNTKSKKDRGLSQKDQVAILDHFRQGKYNV
ncbi:MAG: DEAD/DEAH box helicase [Candidatus Lokiarchaeota archaeon]|nr:DEAD/DEAH box helicase [Candidatus Lokiarchaeota archaeon]